MCRFSVGPDSIRIRPPAGSVAGDDGIYGVVQKIHQDLLQMTGVSMQGGNLTGNFLFDGDAVNTGLLGNHAGNFGNELSEDLYL